MASATGSRSPAAAECHAPPARPFAVQIQVASWHCQAATRPAATCGIVPQTAPHQALIGTTLALQRRLLILVALVAAPAMAVPQVAAPLNRSGGPELLQRSWQKLDAELRALDQLLPMPRDPNQPVQPQLLLQHSSTTP